MDQQWTRRQILKQGGAFGLLASGVLVSGCGGSSGDKSNGDKRGSPTGKVKKLSYDESEQFRKAFNTAIRKGHTVRVKFDGEKKLGKDSELFVAMRRDRKNITNYGEFVESIRENDTPKRRVELARIFEPELLEHDELEEQLTAPSGEVIEPGTVMTVVSILLILAAATYAATEIALGRKVTVVRAGPVAIQFEPV